MARIMKIIFLDTVETYTVSKLKECVTSWVPGGIFTEAK